MHYQIPSFPGAIGSPNFGQKTSSNLQILYTVHFCRCSLTWLIRDLVASTRSEGQIHYKDIIKTKWICFCRSCFVFSTEKALTFCSNKLAITYHVIVKLNFICLFFFKIEKEVQLVGQFVLSHKLVPGCECR